MKNKNKIKVNKYRLGTQEVAVPNKGSIDTIVSSGLSMASTGGALGGPWGAAIGGAIGVAKGIGDFTQANRQNRLAKDQNTYIKNNDLIEDPMLMQQQFKKGTRGIKSKYGKYPNGTQNIKLTLEEKQHLKNLQQKDPNGYKKAIHEMMGYKPTTAPQGSELWKQANADYDAKLKLINTGYHPNRFIETPKTDQAASSALQQNIVDPSLNILNNKTLAGYSDNANVNEKEILNNYNSQQGIDTSSVYAPQYNDGTQGIKPIEVEKDELIFNKKGNKYILKADFKGGKTHNEGGEKYTATEGDIIFPGKDRKRVLNAYKKGDSMSLEAMRMNLPKDVNKAKYGLDNNTDTFLPKTTAPAFNLGNSDFNLPINTENINISRGGFGDYNEPLAASTSNTATPVTTSKTNTGFSNALSTGMEIAPMLYNTIRGMSKPVKTQRNYYTPTQYQYSDISSPARRAAQEAYNVDKYNVNTTRGSRGQIQSYLQNASNNKYKRLADIGNFEGGRKMGVYNQNIEQNNQAKLTNLQLSNQYNDTDAQNRAKRNDFQASAVGQVSQFAQNRRLMNNMAKRDQALTAMDKQKLGIYNQMYPDYKIDYNPNDMELKGIKYKTRQYKKGTRKVKINRYK